MKIVSVAIGDKYELEVERLKKSNEHKVHVFTKKSEGYFIFNEDNLINGLYHKTNFANYFNFKDNTPIIFMDADMFSLIKNPLKNFKVNIDTDFAFVPYEGKWFFPDKKRQEAFNYFKYKINSGFMYFKNLKIAKDICNIWSESYKKRVTEYGKPNLTKYEYDEYALMMALMNTDYKLELLDKKWNNWHLDDREEILNSDSVFFQSHRHLDILGMKK